MPTRYIAFTHGALEGLPEFDEIIALGMMLPDPGTVMYIYGPNGNGKTHMATWLFGQWLALLQAVWHRDKPAKEFPPQGVWISGYDLTQRLKNYSRENFDAQREFQEFTRRQLKVLLIDDVFADRATETDVANIAELVEQRRTRELATIMTGNHSQLDIEQRYSVRLTERVLEGRMVRFTGKSHRLAGRFA